jgi:hypothetical protein
MVAVSNMASEYFVPDVSLVVLFGVSLCFGLLLVGVFVHVVFLVKKSSADAAHKKKLYRNALFILFGASVLSAGFAIRLVLCCLWMWTAARDWAEPLRIMDCVCCALTALAAVLYLSPILVGCINQRNQKKSFQEDGYTELVGEQPPKRYQNY